MISVLYVEDDTSLLEIGKFLLEKDGSIEVDTCSSVNEAFRKISGKRYDIIISDYAMPVMNGMSFLKSLRSAGDTTPFFFFAGKGRKSVIIEALNLGADFYLEKAGNAKVQFEDLLHEIQRVVGQKSPGTKPDQSGFIPASVLESVAEGVLVVDPQGKITAFNQNVLSVLKIPEALVRTGTDSRDLLNYIQDQLEDSDDFSRDIETMSSDPGITCQGIMNFNEGQVFFWSSQAQKTGDTTSGRIWNFRDISEQIETGLHLETVKEQLKAVEEELQHRREELEIQEETIHKNEEIMEIFSRATTDGILTSSGGTIIGANEQVAGMLGYSTAELAGRTLLDFITPDSPGEGIASIRSGSGGRYEYFVFHRDGSSFKAEATGYPVRYRGETILVSIVRRISETPPAVQQKEPPVRGGIQVEPEREESGTSPEPVSEPGQGGEEAGTSPELVSEPGPEGEIRPEPVSGVPIPAGITAKGTTGISLAWEVDDAHLAADAGETQPSPGNENSSLITEIDDVIGPDTEKGSPGKRSWYTPAISKWLSDLKFSIRRISK